MLGSMKNIPAEVPEYCTRFVREALLHRRVEIVATPMVGFVLAAKSVARPESVLDSSAPTLEADM